MSFTRRLKHPSSWTSKHLIITFRTTVTGSACVSVMAARSPNVRLRKALNRKDPSTNLKCPLTAPAKSSKLRVSRLALISSVSQKMIDNKEKAKPVPKVSATPNSKVKQSSTMAKAFTTPRNRKRLSNPNNFRSVRNQKPSNIVVPKNRVVAKTLVFNSPKKAVKTKSSVELKTPIKTLCSTMNKLEINGGKKHVAGKQLPIAASRKQLKGREAPLCHERLELEHDSSNMEIEEKSRNGSFGRCIASDTSESSKGNEDEVCLKTLPVGNFLSKVSSDSSRDINSLSSSDGNKACEESDHGKKPKSSSDMGKVPVAMESDDKENVSGFSDDKENNNLVIENNEKENPSVSDNNRVLNLNDNTILGKQERSTKTQKKSISAATGAQVVKYRKPKPTNPKPFRLRTDERGILKEAHLEKKLVAPLKEITSTVPQGGKTPISKLQKLNQGRIRRTRSDNSMDRKTSVMTPHKRAVPNYQKPIHLIKQQERRQDKAAQELKDNLSSKSHALQPRLVRPRSVLSTKKEKVLLTKPCKLCVIKETPAPKFANPLRILERESQCKRSRVQKKKSGILFGCNGEDNRLKN
ncbi:Neurofilament heavy protein [Quillaja saponaria]|uniref:Neurofilament heavy protein n=1 Tax=Quillaja saponaria TaxID=32244 RepID=A0AAD7P9P7_QUISA|nr:Neurofilament heavy protein [Quillaja saponaria]